MTVYQWLSLVGAPTLILSLFGFFGKKIRDTAKETKAVAMGVQALLRAQMIDDFNHYSEKGYAPVYARENFENCWVQYHALGANGVMADLRHKFMALPVSPQEDDHAQ